MTPGARHPEALDLLTAYLSVLCPSNVHGAHPELGHHASSQGYSDAHHTSHSPVGWQRSYAEPNPLLQKAKAGRVAGQLCPLVPVMLAGWHMWGSAFLPGAPQ